MATTKKAASAAKKAAPKEPTAVEAVSLTVDDAFVVLTLDKQEFRLERDAVQQLRRDFEAAHSLVNPGH